MADSPKIKIRKIPVGADIDEVTQVVNDAIDKIDSHNHSPGRGEQVGSDGLDIRQDVNVNDQNLHDVKSVKLTEHNSSAEVAGLPNSSLYEKNGSPIYKNRTGVELDLAAGDSANTNRGAVETDATLEGNGTAGDPLSVAVPYTLPEKQKLAAYPDTPPNNTQDSTTPFRVYAYLKQTHGLSAPARPTGGSYDEATHTLTAPSGWDNSFPASFDEDTEDLWQVFAVYDPENDTLGAWTIPHKLGDDISDVADWAQVGNTDEIPEDKIPEQELSLDDADTSKELKVFVNEETSPAVAGAFDLSNGTFVSENGPQLNIRYNSDASIVTGFLGAIIFKSSADNDVYFYFDTATANSLGALAAIEVNGVEYPMFDSGRNPSTPQSLLPLGITGMGVVYDVDTNVLDNYTLGQPFSVRFKKTDGTYYSQEGVTGNIPATNTQKSLSKQSLTDWLDISTDVENKTLGVGYPEAIELDDNNLIDYIGYAIGTITIGGFW